MTLQTDKTLERQVCGQKHLKDAARKAYLHQQNQPLADQRILKYLPMVKSIVQQVVLYLNPPLSFEDLVSAGTIGLVKAARDYDASEQADFKTYAYIRIRGAVLDELRSWSFVPSSLSRQIQHIQDVYRQISKQAGREPDDDELARALGTSVNKLHKTLESARGQHFLSIHGLSDEAPALGESLAAGDDSQPSKALEHAELADRLAQAIQQLSSKDRHVILLYYQRELTMKQIAEVMSITESRVSQLHAGALFKLSVKLRQYDESGK